MAGLPDTPEVQKLREAVQPMIRDELMRSWREGVQVGLKMAHQMAEAVRNAAAASVDESCNDCDRAAFEAQIAALGGLMAALLKASSETEEQQR